MSGTECCDKSPQTISVSQRSPALGFSVSYKKSIPIPGLKPKAREELGYPGVGRWTRSAQATGSKLQYLIGLLFLLLPLTVYAVTLCKFTAALHSVWQRCHQEVHQRPYLGRHELAGGINRIHSQFSRAVFGQQLHQPARVQIITQKEARLVHHPLVSHCGGATGVTVVGVHPRAHP